MQLQLVHPGRRDDALYRLPVSGREPDFDRERIDLVARPVYATGESGHRPGEPSLRLRVDGGTGVLVLGRHSIRITCDWELG